jgi:FkbM family methyltransferase
MPSVAHHVAGLSLAVGRLNTLKILLRRLFKSEGACWVAVRQARDSGVRVLLRPTESDLFVAAQVFGWNEYDVGSERCHALNALSRRWRSNGFNPVIVDGGANVGYSSIYFANAYPEAVVLAVEANPDTFEVLKRNTNGKDRIIPINAALWSHEDGVDIEAGDSGSWSDRVSDARSRSLIPSIRLDHLMNKVPSARPLIIKLDIEGVEREACRVSQETLREAACIIIEPHDFMLPGAGSLVPLFAAISGKEVDTLLMSENLTIMDSSVLQNTSV